MAVIRLMQRAVYKGGARVFPIHDHVEAMDVQLHIRAQHLRTSWCHI